MKYKYRLTEEIARWAFEIKLKETKDWDIVFTNPTAGPWKRVEAISKDGRRGEVYRFDKDEERPDIVAVNDKLKCVLIFEAKDTLDKLMKKSQVIKSVRVVTDMANILKKPTDNPFWSFRTHYNIYNALLWGSSETSKENLVKKAFDIYENNISNKLSTTEMIAVECFNINEEIRLKYYINKDTTSLFNILKSLS